MKKKRQRLSAEERREQLLGIAIKVASRRGLGRTAHPEIAREAKVAVSSVFLYFPNRYELITSIVDEVARFYLEMAYECHRPDSEPLSAIRNHYYVYMNSVDTNPEYAQIWLEWATSIRNEDGLWDSFQDFQDKVIRIVAGTIRRCQKQGVVDNALSAPDVARLLHASALTITQMKFMHRSNRLVNRYAKQALALALHK